MRPLDKGHSQQHGLQVPIGAPHPHVSGAPGGAARVESVPAVGLCISRGAPRLGSPTLLKGAVSKPAQPLSRREIFLSQRGIPSWSGTSVPLASLPQSGHCLPLSSGLCAVPISLKRSSRTRADRSFLQRPMENCLPTAAVHLSELQSWACVSARPCLSCVTVGKLQVSDPLFLQPAEM